MQFKTNFILLVSFLLTILAYGQNKPIHNITTNYNQDLIKQQSKTFHSTYIAKKEEALKYAAQNNIPIVLDNENGTKSYLEAIEEDGSLYYITVYNAGAASTSNVDELYEGGALGLNLTGSGIDIGVWDDGRARASHEALVGRVEHKDNAPATPLAHSTHVTGTVIASGEFNPSAQGMAFESTVSGYDFFNDITEIQNEAGDGMIVSNHSYGLQPTQLSEWQFGAYINLSRSIDLIMNSAPYYLPVMAAGNSRNNNPVNNPEKNGFDLITGRQVSKNALVVANVFEVEEYVNNASVQINSTSSYGPTDDLRIKPDIAAKGTNVLSTVPGSDSEYTSLTGTSMASPVVAGTVALLQELYFSLENDYMKSHQVRALLCGTALPAGPFGALPDVRFGFGLMNAEAAATVILNDGFTTIFDEITLNDNDTFTEDVTALGGDIPLEVTIAWNDPAAETQPNGVVDFDEPRLINDLDLRIFKDGEEFFPSFIRPYIFQHTTGVGDNNVDNIEKIRIDAPEGEYTIQVNHKGNLLDGSQDFAIVITGVGEEEFNILATETTQEVCPNDSANFLFELQAIPSFNETVDFSTTGLPDSVVDSFSPTQVSENAEIELDLTNLQGLETGTYNFDVVASTSEESVSQQFTLTVLEDESFNDIIIDFPQNEQEDILLNPIFGWQNVPTAQEYLIQLSENISFDSVLFSETTSELTLTSPELLPGTTYFWSVTPINNCLEGEQQIQSFTTETLDCKDELLATDLPITIDDTATGLYETSINVEQNFVEQISKLRVSVDIDHTYVGDLILTLVSPSGTEVVLLNQVCDQGQNIDVVFDDAGEVFSCNPGSPTLSGTIQPENSLSSFINDDWEGDWTLIVEDTFNGDGGTINNFSLEICDGTGTLSAEVFDETSFAMYPNPASHQVTIDFDKPNGDSTVTIFDINGRIIKQVKASSFDTDAKINVSDFSSGIYMVEISSGGKKSTQKLIVK